MEHGAWGLGRGEWVRARLGDGRTENGERVRERIGDGKTENGSG